MQTMTDKAYLAEAAKEHLFVDPSDHTEMEALIADAYTIPEAAVNRTREILAAARKAAGGKKNKKKKKK